MLFGQGRAGCVLHDVEAFGKGLHHAVLDAVVDHLDEVSGAGGPGVKVTLLDAMDVAAWLWRTRDVAEPGRQRGEDGIEARNRFLVAADHEAIATVQPPDAAAGPDIKVMDALGFQLLA